MATCGRLLSAIFPPCLRLPAGKAGAFVPVCLLLLLPSCLWPTVRTEREQDVRARAEATGRVDVAGDVGGGVRVVNLSLTQATMGTAGFVAMVVGAFGVWWDRRQTRRALERVMTGIELNRATDVKGFVAGCAQDGAEKRIRAVLDARDWSRAGGRGGRGGTGGAGGSGGGSGGTGGPGGQGG